MRNSSNRILLVYSILISCLYQNVNSDENNHHYSPGDQVIVWVNKVGPYNNPQETYTYNTLPFCKASTPLEPHIHALGIGEILEGNELINSDQILKYTEERPKTVLCSQTLTQSDVDIFIKAIRDHYWYQMNVDDLPIWGLVGKVVQRNDEQRLLKEFNEGTALIFTHKIYSISYNGNNIIHVNLTYSEAVKEVKVGETIEFTYQVKWTPTDIAFKDRFDRYLEDEFFEHQIHWFSIFNSFMMVIFLCGLVALILIRTLRNDYAKYTHDEEDMGIERTMGDDTGWKQIHGDVFRKPECLQLYCALIGTGSQLLVLVTCVIIFAIAGSLYVEPGGIVSTAIACYAISSVVSGYVSGSCYYQFFYPNPSPDWIKTMLLTVSLFPATQFFAVFFMNWIAVYYGTTYAIPLGTIIKIILIWAFISFPLSITGTILGRNWSSRSNFPCRINKMARPIPEATWYMKPVFLILLTGILPFGSIFIEMYFIFTSFWNYKFYYVYGFMLLVYVILLIVTICVTIVSTYFVLNSENHHWQWISFLASGSTALYVYIYVIYFYFWKTKMSGFLQTVYYFGYMGLGCFAFFIMLGTLGYAASSIFVKRIYRNIKCE